MLNIFETFFRHCEGLEMNGLTHFRSLVYFYTPKKHQKARDFLMFIGGIEKDQ